MTKGKYQGREHSESRAKRRAKRREQRDLKKYDFTAWAPDAPPTPVVTTPRCSTCSIRDTCMFRCRVKECSGPVDVTPWVDAVQKGLTTVDEVAEMLSSSVGKSEVH